VAVKKKRGKGKYAYQAQKADRQDRSGTVSRAVVSDSENHIQAAANTIEENITVHNENSAVMPVNIGKIDLIYEIKRIAIIAAIVIALLVILFIVLK
jgi:hypothetical protein